MLIWRFIYRHVQLSQVTTFHSIQLDLQLGTLRDVDHLQHFTKPLTLAFRSRVTLNLVFWHGPAGATGDQTFLLNSSCCTQGGLPAYHPLIPHASLPSIVQRGRPVQPAQPL